MFLKELEPFTDVFLPKELVYLLLEIMKEEENGDPIYLSQLS